jgi:hypothetical protein
MSNVPLEATLDYIGGSTLSAIQLTNCLWEEQLLNLETLRLSLDL